MTQRAIAVRNIEQIEKLTPSDDFGRRMKALNLAQARAYLAALDEEVA